MCGIQRGHYPFKSQFTQFVFHGNQGKTHGNEQCANPTLQRHSRRFLHPKKPGKGHQKLHTSAKQYQVNIHSHHQDLFFSPLTLTSNYSALLVLKSFSISALLFPLSTVSYWNLISPAQLKNLQINLNQ